MKTLPIGVSTFERIIAKDVLYVDKTEVLYNLLRGNQPKRYSKTYGFIKVIMSGKSFP